MKLRVQSLIRADGTALTTEEDIEKSVSQIKTVNIPNFQQATVTSLRGMVALKFRLPPSKFSLRFGERQAKESAAVEATPGSSSPSPAIDLSNDRCFLRDTGLVEDDLIQLVSKHEIVHVDPCKEQSSPLKRIKTEPDALSELAPNEDGQTRVPDGDVVPAEEAFMEGSDFELEEDEDDEEVLYPHNAPDDLYDRLLDSVDDLVDMRERFIANPEVIMHQIQENDPTLFQLITENKEEFLALVNSEEAVKQLQMEKEMESALFEEAEEDWGPEMEEAIRQVIATQLGGLGGGEGTDGMEGLVEAGDGEAVESVSAENQIPTPEDEEKIQALVQLGFTYAQCKQAFYMHHRSSDRAANYLFEHPSEL